MNIYISIAFICFLGIGIKTDTGLNVADSILDLMYYGVCYIDNVFEDNYRSPSYMEGNWIPVKKELKGVEIKGTGEIPEDLINGIFARTGPNLKCWPPSNRHHAFSGEAMIHLISPISTKSIKYSNQWIRENLPHQNWNNVGESCPPTFGYADLNAGGWALVRFMILRVKNYLRGRPPMSREKTQAGSTSIVHHGGLTFAATESFLPYQIKINSETIEPLGFYDFGGKLSNRPSSAGPQDGTFSAHPTVDPITGDLFFISTNSIPAGDMAYLDFGRLDKSGQLITYFHIPYSVPTAAFYHDLWQTEKYLIFVDSSLRRDHARIKKFQTLSYYNETFNMRFGVLPKNAKSAEELFYINSDLPGHIWHSVATRVELDSGAEKIILYAPKFSNYSGAVPIHLQCEEPSHLTKFVLDLETKTVTEKIILENVVERPSSNKKFLENRFAYLRSEGLESREMGTELIKVNIETEQIVGKITCPNKECIFNEPLFVPRTGFTAEDDGYIMDIVYHTSTQSSSFMIWNATSFSEKPIFSANLPQRVPYGVHGIWFPPSQ